MLTTLLQFPLFRAGEKTGLITFAHDLIAETLVARAYLRLLTRRPREVVERLAPLDLEGPTLLRFMASRLEGAAREALAGEMRQNNLRGRSFAVGLSLLLLAGPERDLVKTLGASLEFQDLVATNFQGRDLSSISFRGSDLSHTTFSECDLRDARFEGAFLNWTRFEGKNNLLGVHFGDLSRIQSLWVGRRFLDDPDKIRRWITDATGAPEAPGEPCPTALQIGHIFRKYITPLGEPRRDDLKRAALIAGKRFRDAASMAACVDELVQQGYLRGVKST